MGFKTFLAFNLSIKETSFGYRFCFRNTDHVTLPRRFEPLSCSLKRLRASRKMSNFARKYPPGYCHMICVERTKSTSEKGLLNSKETKCG